MRIGAGTVRALVTLVALGLLVGCGGGNKLKLEVERETVIHDPEIQSVSVDGPARLDTREQGRKVNVTMVGDPGLTATFDVEGIQGGFKGRAMQETSPGVYTGSFQVAKGETGSARVTGHLLHPPTGANASSGARAALELFKSPEPQPQGCTQSMAAAFDAQLQKLTVYFAFDKAEISAEAKAKLSAATSVLKSNPLCRLYVLGHTDGKGGERYNQVLSAHRAINVGQALESLGVDPRRMEKHPLGLRYPAATGDSEADRAKNRRVEIRAVYPYR